MMSTQLLDALLTLFKENIPEAEFRRAYPGAAQGRLPEQPVVTGEVDGETVKPGSEETRYRFRIFLPEEAGADRAEAVFAAMCRLAGQRYPGFSAISRGAAERDRTTGLLTVSCTLSFFTQSGGGGGAGGQKVLLGGREYLATGVKTSVNRKSQSLISVGETVPFAVIDGGTEYTVELEGIETQGLEALAGFTAELGENPVVRYTGCRWKSLSDALRKAVFISEHRE